MSVIKPDEAFIRKHYDKTVALLSAYKMDDVIKLVESFADEYAIAPASGRREFHSAFPGGLCFHNLHVLQWLGRFAATMGNFDKSTLLKLAILHDFGKVGDEDAPYYIATDDSWKIKKGMYYDINSELTYMKMPQRSLYLAQKYGVALSQDEYLAVLLADGQLDETNSHYKYKEPRLSTALHFAVYWARQVEKDNTVKWPA